MSSETSSSDERASKKRRIAPTLISTSDELSSSSSSSMSPAAPQRRTEPLQFLRNDAYSRGWVKVLPSLWYGEGVFATRRLVQQHLTSSMFGNRISMEELHRLSAPQTRYIIEVTDEKDDHKELLDLETTWIGKINHAPPKLCNVEMTDSGVRMIGTEIQKGDELFVDYGLPYWFFQLTEVDEDQLPFSSREKWEEMLDRVVDYQMLLSYRFDREIKSLQAQFFPDFNIMARITQQLSLYLIAAGERCRQEGFPYFIFPEGDHPLKQHPNAKWTGPSTDL